MFHCYRAGLVLRCCMDPRTRTRISPPGITTKMELGDVRYIIGLVLASVALPASGDTNPIVRAERGEASYYWQFKTTASGESHDPEAVTCAHRTLAFNTSEVPITFGDPNAALGFPPSTCPEANIVTSTRAGTYSSNNVIASHAHVRRPCAVGLAPADGVTIPLVVYHAPVGQNSSRSDYYGSLIGFASEHLQDASAAYGGDFNVVGPEHETMAALLASGFKTAGALENIASNIGRDKYYDQIVFHTRPGVLELSGHHPVVAPIGVLQQDDVAERGVDAAKDRSPVRTSTRLHEV